MIDPLVVNSPAEFKALECVGVVCLNYGNLLRSVSGPAAALPLDERCVRAFEEAHRLASDNAEMRRMLKGREEIFARDVRAAQGATTTPWCRLRQPFLCAMPRNGPATCCFAPSYWSGPVATSRRSPRLVSRARARS